MPRPRRLPADGVSVVMNTVRVERRWIPESARRPHLETRGPIIVAASLCAVFACFFALGRATHPGRVLRVEAAPSLPVASVSAPIPVRLSSVLPLDVAPVPVIRRAPAPRAPAPAQSEVFRAPVGLSQSAPAVSSAPAGEQTAPATNSAASAPAPAETHSAPSQPAPAAAPPASSHSAPSTGGGGLFDSSG